MIMQQNNTSMTMLTASQNFSILPLQMDQVRIKWKNQSHLRRDCLPQEDEQKKYRRLARNHHCQDLRPGAQGDKRNPHHQLRLLQKIDFLRNPTLVQTQEVDQNRVSRGKVRILVEGHCQLQDSRRLVHERDRRQEHVSDHHPLEEKQVNEHQYLLTTYHLLDLVGDHRRDKQRSKIIGGLLQESDLSLKATRDRHPNKD
mmetsp:Transcript_12700/g.19047  ORF Transcript_12700/g.19047 Transcript_12700/m.19047 type:complete len:200 (-) Transcript_12700:684-1283(-)